MKKTLLKLALVITIFAGSLNAMPIAHAADTNPLTPTPLIKPSTLPGPDTNEQKVGTRDYLVAKVLPRFAVMLIGLVGGLSLLFVIIGGVRMVMIYDNEEAIDKAKKQIIYGIAGFIIALLSYTVVRAITNFEFEGDTNINIESSESTNA